MERGERDVQQSTCAMQAKHRMKKSRVKKKLMLTINRVKQQDANDEKKKKTKLEGRPRRFSFAHRKSSSSSIPFFFVMGYKFKDIHYKNLYVLLIYL